MPEVDIYQHVPENTASDRVAEKAEIVTERLKVVAKQTADERALFPPAPAAKKSATKAASK